MTTQSEDTFGKRQLSWNVSNGVASEGRIYVNGMLLANRSGNGQTYFHHGNYLGTERARTNYLGTVVSTTSSGPFGENQQPLTTDTWSTQDNTGYTGQEHDNVTGTDHFLYRQYQETLGRWMSPDPYDGSYSLFNPQSLNRYAYVMGNPLGFVDRFGAECEGGMKTMGRLHAYDEDGDGCEPGGGGGGYDPNDCNDPHVTCVTADPPTSPPPISSPPAGTGTLPITRGPGQPNNPSNTPPPVSPTACKAAAVATGASAGALVGSPVGGVIGGVVGAAAGGASGTVVEPGGGTLVGAFGGGAAGAATGATTGAWLGGTIGAGVGYIVGNIVCSSSTGGSGGGGGKPDDAACHQIRQQATNECVNELFGPGTRGPVPSSILRSCIRTKVEPTGCDY